MILHNYDNYYGFMDKVSALPHEIHTGSWGTPDFGFTEAIGSLFGVKPTAQGGSNIIPNGGLLNPSPAVLGASTTKAPAPAPKTTTNKIPTGGGGGGYVAPNVAPTNNVATAPSAPVDPYAEIKNSINAAWDSYNAQLNDTANNYLPQQAQAQQGIADTQLTQGQNTINSNKASSLRDIANTTKNAFQAGNNYLGQFGAGDSSAANQYSFAINQQANKQTGDLNNFVNSQLQDLQSKHDTQVNQIAQWLAQQQEAIKQQIAQGQISRSSDIAQLSKSAVDQAMQALNQTKADTQNQYNALVDWAGNNSTNLAQLGQNIANVGRMFSPGQVNMIGQPVAASAYGGFAGNTKDKLFG